MRTSRSPGTTPINHKLEEHFSTWNTVFNFAIVAFTVFLYFFGRGLIETNIPVAMRNGLRVIHFEQRLGIFVEPNIQRLVVGHDRLATFIGDIYIFGHWPVVITTLVWLLTRHPREFAVFRTALILSAIVGMVIFVLFPVAPPRMFPDLGFVDTVTLHTRAYRVLQPPAFTNEYAAMPSLHVGWNLLMGIAIYRNTRHWFWHAFGVLMPPTMYAATILTANHLIVDGILGSIITVTALMIAFRFEAWRARRLAGRG